jgi:hypothetical protein
MLLYKKHFKLLQTVTIIYLDYMSKKCYIIVVSERKKKTIKNPQRGVGVSLR